MRVDPAEETDYLDTIVSLWHDKAKNLLRIILGKLGMQGWEVVHVNDGMLKGYSMSNYLLKRVVEDLEN